MKVSELEEIKERLDMVEIYLGEAIHKIEEIQKEFKKINPDCERYTKVFVREFEYGDY
jgi:uncharacterized coiled-coil DUF342 family protein